MPNMKKPAKPTKPTMSQSHKDALAVGRTEGRAVREYLEALRSNRPTRGRKRTAESIGNRLAAIEAELGDADPVRELKLVQERLDLQRELETIGGDLDLSAVEADFISVAGSYSARNGISYSAWREVGVAPAVLREAGLTRGG
jgi:hypothetical protein